MIYKRFDGVPSEYWNLSIEEIEKMIAEEKAMLEKANKNV